MLKNLSKFSLAEVEEKVLEFWNSHAIFEKSLKQSKGKKPFVFFEGPPTANGRPGIHHVLARSFKDAIPRYKTMKGFFVPRRGGWDTHGLPVELEVEKQLGFSTKRDIEEYGIASFNEACRKSVWTYKDEWEKLTKRMGFWIDLDHPYITYKNSYIESLWWIFGEAWKKQLLYRGHKVVPWCPRCETALSSHELAQGYKEVEDTSVYIKFKVKKGQKIGKNFEADDHTYILSWTTTPWTLPGNVALAVGEHISYVIRKVNTSSETKSLSLENQSKTNVIESFIFAENLEKVLREKFPEITDVGEKIMGHDLVGLSYEPLFTIKEFEKSDTAYKVYAADFVTTEDGTGVVHTAVMYGEDDYNLGKNVGLPAFHTVDEAGRFIEGVPSELVGMKVKDPKTEAYVIHILQKSGNFLGKEKYKHEYPHCWRCSEPLIYYARNSWFIKMSALREQLIKANETIHWIPNHLQKGRFGEWIKDVKDWAISRERFWGTPLPIWECNTCGAIKVANGVNTFEEALHQSTNTYFFMRHGEAENNTRHLINSWPEPEKLPLTEKGVMQVKNAVSLLKKENIDLIYASDITRTKQTAEIIANALGLEVIFDSRLREFDFGDYNGKTYAEYAKYYRNRAEKFERRTPNGENHTDLRKRVYEFLLEIDKKHTNKKILIVTHDGLVYMLHAIANGWSTEDQLTEKETRGEYYIGNAAFEKSKIKNVPRDTTGAFDLHRPFVDNIEFSCYSCKKGIMKRIPEVADVWFDSGAMPFAQVHYPFEKEERPLEYPADFIAEGIDQTRGWFYTLLAVATILGKEAPYKNVISLGLVLDKNGQKMSKSKGNVVNPWDMISKYGIDAVRWYFYTINPPGEPKRFDESELGKVSRQFFSLLYNSFVFFDLYADKDVVIQAPSKHACTLLDTWILARLNKTIVHVSTFLDEYDIGTAGREIENFVNDLSRWYIRRSRRRLQRPENKDDYTIASQVLGYVLQETAKLLAPFTPFFAEALYRSLPHTGVSVHLESWPNMIREFEGKAMDELIEKMEEVRAAASAALAKRAEISIKVRQPLASLTIKNDSAHLEGNKEFLDILKDEINVKEIKFDSSIQDPFLLDINITHELREEGLLREFVRTVQDLRQDAGLRMNDSIVLFVDGPEEVKFVIKKYETRIITDVGAHELHFQHSDKFDIEMETKLDEWSIWVALKKR